jgi:hypothetical protein
LLEHDLGVLERGIAEGRRAFGNIMKFIMMAMSSNFGNMFLMAGATLILPFLPPAPIPEPTMRTREYFFYAPVGSSDAPVIAVLRK